MGKARTPITAKFRVADGPEKLCTGREAQLLIALHKAGKAGVTSLELFRAGWAVRTSAYCHDLRRMGVPICTQRERHDGGSHGRYSLSGPVTLIEVHDATSQLREAA